MGRKYSVKTFELCKKLHELKPDWQTFGSYIIKFKGDEPRIERDNIRRTCYDWAPEYTLEYLLDKLPSTIKDGSGVFALVGGQGQHGDSWNVFYEDDERCVLDSSLNCDAKTPLHALLKLAIIMAEKGIL